MIVIIFYVANTAAAGNNQFNKNEAFSKSFST